MLNKRNGVNRRLICDTGFIPNFPAIATGIKNKSKRNTIGDSLK